MRTHSPTKSCCCDRWRSRRKTFNFSFKIMISYFQTFFSARCYHRWCMQDNFLYLGRRRFLSFSSVYKSNFTYSHTRWCQEQRNCDVEKKKRTTMCTLRILWFMLALTLESFFSFCGSALRSFTYDIIPIIISPQLMRNGEDDVASAWEALRNRSLQMPPGHLLSVNVLSTSIKLFNCTQLRK